MRLLLDTCTFLWMIGEVERLSPEARAVLEDGSNELTLHQASALEIQIKHQIGKLDLTDSPERIVAEGRKLHGVGYRTLSDSDVWYLRKLPMYHRDPFDRILIAHALGNGLKMVTPDPEIDRYPVPVIW